MEKGELTDKLCELIPIGIKNVINNFDEERYNLLNKIMVSGGYINIVEAINDINHIMEKNKQVSDNLQEIVSLVKF